MHLDQLTQKLSNLWSDKQDQLLIAKTIQALDDKYDLSEKISKEAGVEAIVEQMFERLASPYKKVAEIKNKRILDIACGSSTSKAPPSLYFRTLGGRVFENTSREYTALFEPWFCRILVELGADAVGVDIGDLENEVFEHYKVDLGKPGALDFLPSHSFDGIQNSRLFGSPEFTAQFPNDADKLQVAREIVRQEGRLLKLSGFIIHSDAENMVR